MTSRAMSDTSPVQDTARATAYLAQHDDCRVRSVAEIRGSRLPSRAATDHLATAARYNHDRVARTRAQGFATCRRADHAPVDSVAVPLHIPHAVAPYAVGVVGDALFAADADVKRMASAMRGMIARHGEALHRIARRGAIARVH
ncbi:MAG: hypothetical protein ABW173_01430 [Sphingomonas sp.]